MKRRSFITALAGLPVVGFGARACPSGRNGQTTVRTAAVPSLASCSRLRDGDTKSTGWMMTTKEMRYERSKVRSRRRGLSQGKR